MLLSHNRGPAILEGAIARHTVDNFWAKATPKPLQCDIKATPKRVDSQLIGTPRPPQGHPKATPGPPQGYPKASPRLPQGCPKAATGRMQIAECRFQKRWEKPAKARPRPALADRLAVRWAVSVNSPRVTAADRLRGMRAGWGSVGCASRCRAPAWPDCSGQVDGRVWVKLLTLQRGWFPLYGTRLCQTVLAVAWFSPWSGEVACSPNPFRWHQPIRTTIFARASRPS